MPGMLPSQHRKTLQLPVFTSAPVKEKHVHIRFIDLSCSRLAHFEKPTGFRKTFASQHGAGKLDVAGLLFSLAHASSCP